MFGKGYVTDMCISFFKKENSQLYVAECLRIITENTAKMTGGAYMTAKLEDVLYPKPVDHRTADDIIGNIKNKIGKMK